MSVWMVVSVLLAAEPTPGCDLGKVYEGMDAVAAVEGAARSQAAAKAVLDGCGQTLSPAWKAALANPKTSPTEELAKGLCRRGHSLASKAPRWVKWANCEVAPLFTRDEFLASPRADLGVALAAQLRELGLPVWDARPLVRWLAGLDQGDPEAGGESRVTFQLQQEARAVEPLVKTPWVRELLRQAAQLRSIGRRTYFHDAEKTRYLTEREAQALEPQARAALVRREVDDGVYWGRYSTPIAYARAFDVLGQAGFQPSGAKVLDFGYGNLGQLFLLSRMGAQPAGIEVDPLLPKLYSEQKEVRALHGYFPTDAELVAQVGGDYDLFISKNTLKRGYIHPAQEVPKRQRIDLGVSDEAFVAKLYALLKPGGRVLIYNISPAPAPQGKPYIPWADGRSPFSRETWEKAGFRVVAFDQDDTAAMREHARAMRWDVQMDLQRDLFAQYTLVEKPAP